MARFSGPTQSGGPCGICPLIPIVVLVAGSLGWLGNPIRASPLEAMDLSLGLSSSSDMMVDRQQVSRPAGELMEQIMNDRYEHDFALSIALLNQFASSLEGFIRSKHLESLVENKATDAITVWATNNGAAGQAITKELDLVVATFWSRFKPLLESVIAQRPAQLKPNDLDFRCTQRRMELGDLMALAAQSSLYSIYMDTFLYELYHHCSIRKLALLKTNGIEPSQLMKQFVAIYLQLPALGMHDTDEAKQLLVKHAMAFNPAHALATIGPLTKAASLVVDSRTFLAMTPDTAQAAKMVQEFGDDCQLYIQRLGSVWGDFDDFIKAISTSTTNLEELNEKVKFAAPRLTYATICSRLLQLPR